MRKQDIKIPHDLYTGKLTPQLFFCLTLGTRGINVKTEINVKGVNFWANDLLLPVGPKVKGILSFKHAA